MWIHQAGNTVHTRIRRNKIDSTTIDCRKTRIACDGMTDDIDRMDRKCSENSYCAFERGTICLLSIDGSIESGHINYSIPFYFQWKCEWHLPSWYDINIIVLMCAWFCMFQSNGIVPSVYEWWFWILAHWFFVYLSGTQCPCIITDAFILYRIYLLLLWCDWIRDELEMIVVSGMI